MTLTSCISVLYVDRVKHGDMRGFVALLGSAVRFEGNKQQPMAMRVCFAKIVPFVRQWQKKGSALNRLAPVGYIEHVCVERWVSCFMLIPLWVPLSHVTCPLFVQVLSDNTTSSSARFTLGVQSFRKSVCYCLYQLLSNRRVFAMNLDWKL